MIRETVQMVSVDFRPLFPALENLHGLQIITGDEHWLGLAEHCGLEDLTNRVTSLRGFKWPGLIRIDATSEVRLCVGPSFLITQAS